MEEIPEHIEYIFIDESGDLGLSGSLFFTIVALNTRDVIQLRRIIKRLRERKLKKKMKELVEIKAYNSNPEIRRYVLNSVSACDCSISAIAIPKNKIHPNLLDHKDKLYNYLGGLLFEHITLRADIVELVIDQKDSNRLLREDFNSYIKGKITSKAPNIDVRIKHFQSHASQELQVVDFVAWAINRKFSFNDSSYYDLISSKIINKGKEVIWND